MQACALALYAGLSATNRGTEVAMIVPPAGGQAVRGHPVGKPQAPAQETRARVVVAVFYSCDCFGGTTHREGGGVSSDSHPFR